MISVDILSNAYVMNEGLAISKQLGLLSWEQTTLTDPDYTSSYSKCMNQCHRLLNILDKSMPVPK